MPSSTVATLGKKFGDIPKARAYIFHSIIE